MTYGVGIQPWDNNQVHRLLIGGPADNKIVYVHENVDPFQVVVDNPLPGLMPGEIIGPDDPKLTMQIGRYHLDDYYWNHDQSLHTYYRWEGMSRKAAAKIHMRRSGRSLFEIYRMVEWESWGG